MRILKQICKDREGNDCWIYETVAVVISHDDMFLVYHCKVTGYYESSVINTTKIENSLHLKHILVNVDYNLTEEEIEELCNINYH